MNEQQVRKLLQGLGITDVQFLDPEHYHGETLLPYTHTDGEPVLDGPGVLLSSSGSVRLIPWMDI